MRYTGFMLYCLTTLGAFAAGCSPGTQQALSTRLTEGDDSTKGAIEGWVRTLDGASVADATVEASGVATATDIDGWYSLQDVPSGDNISLFARSDRTTLGQVALNVPANETATATITVLPLSFATLPDAAAGGVVETDDGLRVSFAPHGIINANGETVDGAVELAYALFDTNEEVAAAPGNLKAENGDASPSQLQSDGMVSLVLRQDGEELNLGQPAEISFPEIGITPAEGAVDGLYYFAEDTGLWRQEGVGVSEAGRYVATVEHLTVWNHDWSQDLRQTACGHLLWPDGAPVANQLVGVILDGGIHTNFTTASDGGFEITVPDDSTFNLGFRTEEDAETTYYWTYDNVTTSTLADGEEVVCIDIDPDGLAGLVPNGTDVDSDGAESAAWGGEDCDDADSSVTIEQTWYQDLDGDGYGAGGAFVTCTTPAQSVLIDGDCAWNNAAVNPGASEHCDDADGLDNDCDGWTDPACGTGWMRGLAGLTDAADEVDCDVIWRQTWTSSEGSCPECSYGWEVASTLDEVESVGLSNCTVDASFVWTIGFDEDYSGLGYGVLWMADETGTWTPTWMNATLDDDTGMLSFYSLYNVFNAPYYDDGTGQYVYYTRAYYGEAGVGP